MELKKFWKENRSKSCGRWKKIQSSYMSLMLWGKNKHNIIKREKICTAKMQGWKEKSTNLWRVLKEPLLIIQQLQEEELFLKMEGKEINRWIYRFVSHKEIKVEIISNQVEFKEASLLQREGLFMYRSRRNKLRIEYSMWLDNFSPLGIR